MEWTYQQTLCRARWDNPSIDFSTRALRTCCKFYGKVMSPEDIQKQGKDSILNNEYQKELRQKMLKGEPQIECQGCYDEEKRGVQSFRPPLEDTLNVLAKNFQISTQELVHKLENQTWSPEFLNSSQPKELELSFGNTCDLKCVYCGPKQSSRWESELIQYGEYSIAEKSDRNYVNEDLFDAFWSWYETEAYRSLQYIHIIGGEPFMSERFFRFLDRLNDFYTQKTDAPTLKINIFSNLNHGPSVDRFLKFATKLSKKVEILIYFSGESIGQRAEFIRNGIRWDDAVQNVLNCAQSPNLQLSFSITVNTLAVKTLTDYFQFILEVAHQTLKSKPYYRPILGLHTVHSPSWLSPLILDASFAPDVEKAFQFLQQDSCTRVFDPISRQQSLNILQQIKDSLAKNDRSESMMAERTQFLYQIHKIAERRNLNFLGTFPEFRIFARD